MFISDMIWLEFSDNKTLAVTDYTKVEHKPNFQTIYVLLLVF